MKLKLQLVGVFTLFISVSLPMFLYGQEDDVLWIVPPVMKIDGLEISPKYDDKSFIVERRGKKGVFNLQGDSIVQIEYSSIRQLPCGWILGHAGRTQDLFNSDGINIGLPYDKFHPFNNGTAVVFKEGKCGLIDMSGEEIIPLQYEKYRQYQGQLIFSGVESERIFDMPAEVVYPNVTRVEEAKARSLLARHYVITLPNTKRGILNLNKDTIVPALYHFKDIHAKGYIVASFDKKTWGVIDTLHQTLYPFTANRMGKWTKSGILPVRFEKQWSLLSFPEGEVVIPPGKYESIEVYDPDNDLFIVKQNGLEGLIDLKENFLLPCKYTYISSYTHTTTELSDKDNKRGFWHRPSGFLQEPVYRKVRNLNDTLITVHTDSTNAVINSRTGKVVIPFSDFYIESVGNYFDSYKKYDPKISRTYGGLLHGLYDRKGTLVFPHDSVDIVVVTGDDSYWIFPHYKESREHCEQRTPDGELLRSMAKSQCDIQHLGFQVKGLRGAPRTAFQIAYRDEMGNERYYEKIGKIEEGLYLVKKEEYWGFTDRDGKLVVPAIFDSAKPSSDGYIRVVYKGKWGVIQNPVFNYFEQFEKRIKQ